MHLYIPKFLRAWFGRPAKVQRARAIRMLADERFQSCLAAAGDGELRPALLGLELHALDQVCDRRQSALDQRADLERQLGTNVAKLNRLRGRLRRLKALREAHVNLFEKAFRGGSAEVGTIAGRYLNRRLNNEVAFFERLEERISKLQRDESMLSGTVDAARGMLNAMDSALDELHDRADVASAVALRLRVHRSLESLRDCRVLVA